MISFIRSPETPSFRVQRQEEREKQRGSPVRGALAGPQDKQVPACRGTWGSWDFWRITQGRTGHAETVVTNSCACGKRQLKSHEFFPSSVNKSQVFELSSWLKLSTFTNFFVTIKKSTFLLDG